VDNNDVGRACPSRENQVKKGVWLDRLGFASWNTLTSKSIELVKALQRHKVNIACV